MELTALRFGRYGAGRVWFALDDGLLVQDAAVYRASGAPLVTVGRAKLTYAANNLAAQAERISVPPLADIGTAQVRASLPQARGDIAAGRIRAGGIFEMQGATIPSVEVSRDLVAIPNVALGGSTTQVERHADGSWNLPALSDVQAVAAEFGSLYDEWVAGYSAAAPKLHRATFWLVVIVLLVVAALKAALTAGGIRERAISAAATVGAGGLLYLLGIHSVLACVIAGAAVGAALEIFIYRKAPEWHQWCEPVAVDLVAPLLIVFSLVAHAFVFPAPPSAPPRVSLAQLRTGESRVAVRDASLGEASIAIAAIAVDGISFDRGRLAVDRSAVRDTAIETTPAALRATVPLVLVEGTNVSAHGSAESPLLADRLNQIRYLPDAIRRPGPVTFCVNWKLGEELPAACEGSATLALRGSIDSQFRYTAESAAPGVLVTLSGEGPRLRVTGIRAKAPSPVQIAGGSGTINVAQPVQARIDLRDIAAAAFSAARLRLRATGPNVRAEIQRVHVGPASIEAATVEARRDGGRAEIRELHLSAAPWLDATFAGVIGEITGKWLKNSFAGTFSAVSDTGKLSPVAFSAAPLEGTLEIADQPFVLDQTAASFLPVPLHRASGGARGRRGRCACHRLARSASIRVAAGRDAHERSAGDRGRHLAHRLRHRLVGIVSGAARQVRAAASV